MNHIVYLGNNVVERRNIEKTLTEHGYSVINFRYLPEITNPLALVIVSRDDKTSTAEVGWSSEEIQKLDELMKYLVFGPFQIPLTLSSTLKV